MEDINLTTVSTSALVKELKARFEEFESAKKELGFASAADSIPVARHSAAGRATAPARKERKTGTSGPSPVRSAAKKLQWAKTRKESKAEIARLEREVEEAKKAAASA